MVYIFYGMFMIVLVEVHEANVVDVDATVSIGCFRFRMQDNSKEYITCFCS